MNIERAGETGSRDKAVVGQQIADGRRALAFDVRAAADDGAFVERDAGDALRRLAAGGRGHRPSPPSRIVSAGASAARPAASQRTSALRFRKSRTPRPEAKRALRMVGSTWLGPAM